MNTERDILLLAIESSCDDTSAAVIKNGKILANIVANQEVHSKFGGVVPELASRSHQENIVPVVEEAMKMAGIVKEELTGIAVTQGPGLLGSLLVGVSFSKALAYSLGIPLVGVNHLDAHIAAHYIDDPKPSFPFICLLVSGGHTRILKVHSPTKMELMGQSLDDAAGEAFDKSAKMLGLEYPGGPLIQKFAEGGDPLKFTFSTGNVGQSDYSFSGLKTNILNFLRKSTQHNERFIKENLSDLCASIQYTIVEYLLKKVEYVCKKEGIKEVALAGGVSANAYLRSRLDEKGAQNNWKTYIPKFEYCTDNAGMIAMEGYNLFLEGQFAGMNMSPYAREK